MKPVEDFKLQLRRWAIRADVAFGLAAVIALTAFAAWQLHGMLAPTVAPNAESKNLASAIVAAWVAIMVASIGGAVRITSTREGLVSLFTSEIRAIQYGLGHMDIFRFWAVLHEHPEMGAMGFADVPRDENYFALFHSVIGNVANLPPRVVEAIVRFYTYLKMSRDAAAALGSWEVQQEPIVRKQHVKYVVRLLALSMMWGFVALWYLGQRARESDAGMLADMMDAFLITLGRDAFKELVDEHPASAAFQEFFQNRLCLWYAPAEFEIISVFAA